MNLQNDFPLLKNNPWMIYLDNTATTQKPQAVIDEVTRFLSYDYANIHRGSYDISARSEKIYEESKKEVAQYIWAFDWREVVYTYNSNYALNILAQSLKRSNYFQKGDKVLISVVEHHANIVPWLILKEEVGIEVEYIELNSDYSLNLDDLKSKLDERVKVVSITHVSNVTGQIFDLQKVGELIKNFGTRKSPQSPLTSGRNTPLFIVDASQSVPHFQVNVQEIGCDFLFFTGHKVMADSGIGVLWGRKEIFEKLKPIFSGGWAIRKVEKESFLEAPLPDRFEMWTPNVTWAASLLAAFRYIKEIWGYQKVQEIEDELVSYTLEQFKLLNNKLKKQELPIIQLIWSDTLQWRVGVFSFVIEWIHSLDIADYLADNNICIRAWQHCAEPFLTSLQLNHTCRMSIYIYNTKEDIDTFFKVLEKAVYELK